MLLLLKSTTSKLKSCEFSYKVFAADVFVVRSVLQIFHLYEAAVGLTDFGVSCSEDKLH